jgi:hypothetical protein
MAARSTQLVLDALGRAAAAPAGLPLLGGRAADGLFNATTAGKVAARHCLDDGLLRVVRTEARGKSPAEICAITEKGLAHLLDQVSPRRVLDEFVRALDARAAQLDEMVGAARQAQAGLEGLRASAEAVLARLKPAAPQAVGPAAGANGSDTWKSALLTNLAAWHAARPAEDCPLPELFRQGQAASPALSVGRFHDALREYHAGNRIYLHPWTGPLYDLPEPAYALLVGHEVAYYASLRP